MLSPWTTLTPWMQPVGVVRGLFGKCHHCNTIENTPEGLRALEVDRIHVVEVGLYDVGEDLDD